MGWHYETPAERRAQDARRRSMSREAFRAYENEQHRLFVNNPANAHKEGSTGCLALIMLAALGLFGLRRRR